MRRVLVIAAAALGILALFACGGSSSGSSSGDSVSISGQVVSTAGGAQVTWRQMEKTVFADLFKLATAHAQTADAPLDGAPLEGATVQLQNASGVVVAQTTTDANGEFKFFDVIPDTYSIQIIDPRIETLTISEITVLSGDTTVVRGTVTSEGGVASVAHEVESCSVVGTNDAQMAHAQNLADASGTPIEEVIAIREGQCLGWGEIAAQLGVEPGVLGLGKSPHVGGGKPAHAGPKDPKDSKNGGPKNGQPKEPKDPKDEKEPKEDKGPKDEKGPKEGNGSAEGAGSE